MLKNYIKIALRHLWKQKWFSLINIGGLAIAFTTIFFILLYVSFELSYDKFHSKGNHIYRIHADIKTPSDKFEWPMAAWAVAPHLQSDFDNVENSVRIKQNNLILRKNNLKYKEDEVLAVDKGFFSIFDFKLLQGNPKTVLEIPFSLVLSQTTAKKYFGTENPLGKTLTIISDKEEIATITGIMEDFPKNSHLNADILLSMSTYTQVIRKKDNLNNQWGSYSCLSYILTSKNTEVKELENKLPAFLRKNSGEHMDKSKMYPTLFLKPLKSIYLFSKRGANAGGNITNVYIFSIIALFILFIATINFINLSTAKSVERAKEVGIRKVLGSEKKWLIFQFLGESIFLSVLAYLVSLILMLLLKDTFNSIVGKEIIENIFSKSNYFLLLFGLAIIIGTSSGLYPAFILSAYKPVSVLKGVFSTNEEGRLLRKVLVVIQFTISITLIIGIIVVYRQTQFMQNQELGYNKNKTLILRTNNTFKKHKLLKESISKLPEVIATSSTSGVPGGGFSIAYSKIENNLGEIQISSMNIGFVDYDYIPLFDIEIIAGRNFSRAFSTDSTQAMIVNQKAIKLFGYNTAKDAIGAKFNQWGRKGKIIGVVKNFHFRDLKTEIKPLSLRIEPNRSDQIVIKYNTENLKQFITTIKTKWEQVFPNKPFDYFFLEDRFNNQFKSQNRFSKILFYFSCIAIFISCLGLLGLVAYSTYQRKKEIGIRKVNGASITSIVQLLSKEFIKLVAIAFVIATPIAWYVMDNWLQGFAYRITIQWWMFTIAGIIAISIALLTVSFHAIKASLANPIKSLQTE